MNLLNLRAWHLRGGWTGRVGRVVHTQVRIARLCLRRMAEHNATAMSAALCFRTLFAMIPTLVLAFLVLRAMGVTQDMRQDVHRLLDSVGLGQIQVASEEPLPATGVQPVDTQPALTATAPTTSPAAQPGGAKVARLSDWIERLIANVESQLTVGKLGPIGVLLLVWAAVSLLSTVEAYLNRIFEAPESRSVVRRLLLYWSVITLVPIVLTAAFATTSGLLAQLAARPILAWLVAPLVWLGRIVVSMLLLALVYMLMPNTRVRFKPAFTAALLAVPLWALAEWGFSVYVKGLVGKGSLYGTLGLIPLFLIWLNLCWLIFLFSAEYAHAASNVDKLERREAASRMILGAWDVLAGAVAIAGPYQAGSGPVSPDAITQSLTLSDAEAQVVIDRLCEAGIICPVVVGEEDRYVLSRPAERITVSDILAAGSRTRAADSNVRPATAVAAAVAAVEARADECLARLTLADLAKT